MKRLLYGFAFIVLSVVSAAVPAHARQWVEFSSNDRTSWIDVDSINGVGRTREFWVKSIYQEKTTGYLRHASSMLRHHVNCDTQKTRVSKIVLYNSAGSLVYSGDGPMQWQDTVPDSLGEAMLVSVCKMKEPQSDATLRSRPSFGTAITQGKAIGLIQQWLQAKQKLFAPPYDREIAAKLTTGRLYQGLTSPGGSIDWLEKNNAYYEYGIQSVKEIKQFSVNDNSFVVVASIIGPSTFLNPQTGFKKSNSTGRSTIRYEFVRVNNSWLLENYEELSQ